MKNLIITIATLMFIAAVMLQIICTMHYLSLILFAKSTLLFLVLKDNQIKKRNSKNNEQHNQT